jgi:hypothetical protein
VRRLARLLALALAWSAPCPSALCFCALALAVVAAGSATSAAGAQQVVRVEYTPTERAQIAIWLERADGTFLETVMLTQAVALRGIGNRPGASQMNSGFRWPYGRREGVLPVWAHRRASAPDAELFRRVIFQDRTSEGHASRSSNDHSRDDYFCLSFRQATTTRDALDAVSCASVFNSDKGRFATDADMAVSYFEPAEMGDGISMPRPLDRFSLYPPRRDVHQCIATGCFDHPDVAAFADEARRVMPDIDAITRATPDASPQRLVTEWEHGLGEFALLIEVNTEGDYNASWGPEQFPTPRNPPPDAPGAADYWDHWALSYGYPYRGQPSVVYRVPFTVETEPTTATASDPEGYGSIAGWGREPGEMRTMDATISDDPGAAPGSGADRLRASAEGWKVRVVVAACRDNVAPGAINELAIRAHAEPRDAHRFATLSFVAPTDDASIERYEVRVGTEPIVDVASFMRAIPANAAEIDSVALEIPVLARAGERVEADFGGLSAESHYYVAIRAIDGCGAEGPIAVAEHTTPPIVFTTVSPCFVATAAYGTPMADEIGALRRFRDRHLRTSSVGPAMVAAYQSVGPVLAEAIRDHEDARAVVRAMLAPIVALARWLD